MNDLTVIDDGNNNDVMMAKVLEAGNIEVLERFIALREREETRQAAIEFDAHFSMMQAEFPVVEKRKSAKDYSGNEMYKYAPLEDLQIAVGKIISKHGFSITFSEETIEGGKRVFMRISGHGSSRTNSVDTMALDSNKRTNATQAGIGTSSYGMRAAYKAGLGLIIAGEDDDAQDSRDPAIYAEATRKIADARSLDVLMTAWKGQIFPQYQGDTYAMKILTAAKDKRKGELSGTANG